MGSFIAGFIALIQCLPELLKLVNTVQKQIKNAETDRKVKDDFAKINEAFEKKDASMLSDIFRS